VWALESPHKQCLDEALKELFMVTGILVEKKQKNLETMQFHNGSWWLAIVQWSLPLLVVGGVNGCFHVDRHFLQWLVTYTVVEELQCSSVANFATVASWVLIRGCWLAPWWS
jgi:hypothetical protein